MSEQQLQQDDKDQENGEMNVPGRSPQRKVPSGKWPLQARET